MRTLPDVNCLGFEEALEQHVHRPLIAMGARRTGQVSSRNLGLRGCQLLGDPTCEERLYKGTVRLVSESLGLPPMKLPSSLMAIRGRRTSKAYSVREDGPLPDFVEKNRVFSYAIPNQRRINFTTGIQI